MLREKCITKQYYENLSGAFLAHFCRRLSDLVIEQSSTLIADNNLKSPSTAISTLFYLDDSDKANQKVTVSNLAEALGVSHQMATQRVNSLQKLGLVDRIDSEEDARAKVVVLTKLGKYEVLQLRPFSDEVTKAFNDLELELGAPLVALIRKAELSLLQVPLKQRIAESKS